MSSDIHYSDLFSKTKPSKLFFKTAIPGAIGMLASNVYYLCESLLVGRLLGEAAFAALNLALPFVLINFAFADLIGVGSSVVLAIKLGEGEKELADRLFSTAVLLIFVLLTLSSIVFYAIAPWIFSVMGADAEVASLAVGYMRVYVLFTPITGLVFAFDNYLRICGKIRRSMMLNIFLASVSAVIEFTFMYFMRLPLPFAALGTSLGMVLTAVFAVFPFIRGKLALKFRKPSFNKLFIQRIIANGSPAFLSNMSGRVLSVLMNYLLLLIGGTAAVSIYGILMSIDGIVIPLMYGLCDSLQPAVGYNYGAKLPKRVKSIEKYCFASTAVLSISFAFLMFFNEEVVIRMFLSDMDTAFMASAVFAIRLFAINYLVRWISYAAQSFFSAIGSSLLAVIVSLSSAIAFPLLSIGILWPLGVNGLYLNTTSTALLAAILSIFILIPTWRKLSSHGKCIYGTKE